jgi:hypothetical protein
VNCRMRVIVKILISADANVLPKQVRGPSLKAKISRRIRLPSFGLSNHRSGRKVEASGPQTPGSVWMTFTGIDTIVPFGITSCISEVPGIGSESGTLIVSDATW